MKKLICLLVATACLVGTVSCKKKNESESVPPKGELTLSAVNTKSGFNPSSAMDGSLTSGWVGSKKATESNFQVFDIDFGDVKSFSTITLDDSFTDGYTNRRPDYMAKIATYQNGDVSSLAQGTTPAGLLVGEADGQSWKSENIPTQENPEWVWLSLSSAVEVTKLELNNEMNNSVPVSFELYYSAEPHNRRNPEEYTDLSTYTLISKITDNTENIIEIELEEKITVRDLFLKVYSQQNEGEAVIASLDEILLFGDTPDDYYEEHQPVKFTFMGSNDGTTFDVIVEEFGNYNVVWAHTLETAVSYRYIRYIVFSEYNNNYPSIGELTFR